MRGVHNEKVMVARAVAPTVRATAHRSPVNSTAVQLYWYWNPTALGFWLILGGNEWCCGADSSICTGHSSRTRPDLAKPHGGPVEFVALRPLTEFQSQNCSDALGRPRGEIRGILADPVVRMHVHAAAAADAECISLH